MFDPDEAMLNYAREVVKLLALYSRVHVQLDRAAMHELQQQLVLVDSLTLVNTLPIIAHHTSAEGK